MAWPHRRTGYIDMAWHRIEELFGISTPDEKDAPPGLVASLKRAQIRLSPSIKGAIESLPDHEYVSEDMFVVGATLLAFAMEMMDERVYAHFPEDAKEAASKVFVLASLLLDSEYYEPGGEDDDDDDETSPPDVILH